MGNLSGVGLTFKETMSGYLGQGQSDPRQGADLGRRENAELRFDVTITIEDLEQFLKVGDHQARLDGTVTGSQFGEKLPIRDGVFNLFTIDPATSTRQMKYAFAFTAGDGQNYFLHGHKEIEDDPGRFDVVEDMTRLFTVVYQGNDV